MAVYKYVTLLNENYNKKTEYNKRGFAKIEEIGLLHDRERIGWLAFK